MPARTSSGSILDYTEGLEVDYPALRVEQAGPAVAAQVKAISTRPSTPIAVDKPGTAVAPPHSARIRMQFVLWKDHTATGEAARSTSMLPDSTSTTTSNMSAASIRNGSAAVAHSPQRRSRMRPRPVPAEQLRLILPVDRGRDVHQLKRGVCLAGHKAL